MTCRTISLVICEKEKELHYENVAYFKSEKLVIHLVSTSVLEMVNSRHTHTISFTFLLRKVKQPRYMLLTRLNPGKQKLVLQI